MTNTNRIKSLLAAVAVTASAHATAIVIPDFSFESPDGGVDLVSGTASFVNNPASAWLRSGTWGIQDWTDADFAGTTGDVSPLPGTGDANQAAYVNFGATIYQSVGALEANTTYTMTVAIGNRISKNYADTITLRFYNGDDLTGTLLGSEASTTVPANGDFIDYSFSFTSGAITTGNLVIAIHNHNTFAHTVIDNVRLDASAIPEPSAFAALAGIVGLGFAASRRRRSA